MKDTFMYIGLIVLMGVGMLISYNQGVHNGKIEMCQTHNLYYGKSISGDRCLTQTERENVLYPKDKEFNITGGNQWLTT